MNTQKFSTLPFKLKESGNFNSGILCLIKTICLTNDWPYGEIWKPDKKDKFMLWSGFWSRNNHFFEKFSDFSSLHRFGKGVGLIGKAWEQKRLLWSKNFSKDKLFLRSDIAQLAGLNFAVGIPILNQNEVSSLICFFVNNSSLEDRENAELLFNQSELFGGILAQLD